MFVDEVLGQSNRAVESAFVDLKLQILSNRKPGETSHAIRFSDWTFVLGREAFVSKLTFGQKFSQPYEIHAVSPFLVFNVRTALGNPDFDLGGFAPHPRVHYEFYEELRRVGVLAPQGFDDALVSGDSELIIYY
jgi:hypothetical protein